MKINIGWVGRLMILMLVGMEAQIASAQIYSENLCDGPGDLPGCKTVYEDPLAVVCIANETDDRLIYNYRWGQRSWRGNRSDSGETWRHYLSLNAKAVARDNFTSPTFKLQFDKDRTDGSKLITIDLKTYVVGKSVFDKEGCDVGKRYELRYGQSSRWIELKEVD